MAEQVARTGNATENLAASVRVPSPPPPPPSSLPRSVCGVHSSSSFQRLFSLNKTNFERSAAPSKVLYFRNDVWMYFSDDVVETLRTGFLERKPIIEASIGGVKYIFDLKRMLQTDFLTGNSRSVSWIDENGKCFFPNGFISEEEFTEPQCENKKDDDNNNNNNNCNPKIDIELKIDGTSLKRKREEEPEVSSAYKAVGQDVIKYQGLEEGGAAKWPNTKLLRETERDYMIVKDHFLNAMKKVDGGVRIISIHQCNREAHMDKVRLQVFQVQTAITKAARGTSNMVCAWFGASAKDVGSILVHGFGSPCKVPATDVHGVGLYFSPIGLPHLSAKLADSDDNGINHLILCRIVLGNVEKVDAGSQQYHPSSVDFDSGSNDPNNPKWYVVWSTNANRHILPECVVSFRPSVNIGQPMPEVGVKYSLQELFSKMEGSLPQAKIQEIWISYNLFRAGTLTRDAFSMKLRHVAGDEVLRSAIRKIAASKSK